MRPSSRMRVGRDRDNSRGCKRKNCPEGVKSVKVAQESSSNRHSGVKVGAGEYDEEEQRTKKKKKLQEVQQGDDEN